MDGLAKTIHDLSFKNEKQLEGMCGCFYCLQVFNANEVVEWITEQDNNKTAVCPSCGIDSVISLLSLLPVLHEEFFQKKG